MLALCGLVLRAVLPAGWMPNPHGAANGIPLVICTMDGFHRIDPAPSKHPAQTHHDVCPFAAAAHLAPPQASPSLLPAIALAALTGAPVVNIVVTGHEPDPAHGPRAPPAAV